tara:strand:+ start:48 stop:296 length:249 start_codon:yes stop_codon:yes gene_type:complete
MQSDMVSVNDERFISLACELAEGSVMLQKHGCVAVREGRVVGTGCNNYRNYSKDGFLSNCCSCHAEIAATRSACKNSKVGPR